MCVNKPNPTQPNPIQPMDGSNPRPCLLWTSYAPRQRGVSMYGHLRRWYPLPTRSDVNKDLEPKAKAEDWSPKANAKDLGLKVKAKDSRLQRH